MEIISVYYSDGSEFKNFQVAISDWYCKPAILCSFAKKLGCLFLTCSKYGCRQFEPFWCNSFPIHNVHASCYKKNLKWVVLEFSNHGNPFIFDSNRIYDLYI